MPIKIEHKIIDDIEYKKCSKCKDWLLLTDFYSNKRLWDGLNALCVSCTKETNRAMYVKNKERIKKKAREYYWLNKEKVDNRNKQYYKKNKDKINSYKSEWQKMNREKRNKRLTERYANDVNYRIAVNLRNRVLKAVGNNQKYGSTIDILGCSIEYFKHFISSKFSDGMSWNNHGDVWHVDHIRPCSSFDLSDEEQQRICFHYTNMQPLYVADNLSKGNKII